MSPNFSLIIKARIEVQHIIFILDIQLNRQLKIDEISAIQTLFYYTEVITLHDSELSYRITKSVS